MDNNFLSPYLNNSPLVSFSLSITRRRLARRTLKATKFKEDGLGERYRGWLVALTTGNIPATGPRIPPSSLHLAHFHTRVGPFEYPLSPPPAVRIAPRATSRAFFSLGTRRRVFAPANYIADVEAWRSDIDLGRRRRNGMMLAGGKRGGGEG